MTSARRAQYERRAAQLGMTLEQFFEFLDEQRRYDELRDLHYNRDRQRQVIARKATAHGRTWSVFA